MLAHLSQLYTRYGNVLDNLHKASDPPQPTEITAFLNQAFEALIHLNDFMLIHLDKPRSRKAELNREMALQGSIVSGLDSHKYEEFSHRVIDVPLVVRNMRVVARQVGVRNLDGVLVDGVHIPAGALVPAEAEIE